MATDWEDIGTRLPASLSPPPFTPSPAPRRGLCSWPVLFTHIQSGSQRSAPPTCTSHAVRRPALSSFLLRNCSPYLFSYCLITWLGAQSTVIKIANSLFFRLFRRGLKTSFKMRFACLITSTSGKGTSHNVPHGINGLSKFKPLLHYP